MWEIKNIFFSFCSAIFSSLSMCVWQIYMSMYMHVWSPEENIKCSVLSFHALLYSGTGSPTEHGTRLSASKPQQSSYLCPSSTSVSGMWIHCHVYIQVLGISDQVLMLAQQQNLPTEPSTECSKPFCNSGGVDMCIYGCLTWVLHVFPNIPEII